MNIEDLHREKERAILLSNQGRFKEADALLRQLYEESKKIPDQIFMADVLYDRAWNWFVSGRLQQARELFEKLDNFTRSFYPEGQAAAFNGYGLIDRSQGKLESALKNFQRSLEISKMFNLSLGAPYGNTGTVYRLMGRFDEALEYLKTSKKIFEEEKSIIGQINAITIIENITDIYIDKGELDVALELAQQAVHLRERIAPIRLGSALYVLAQCYKAMGRPVDAFNVIKRAISHNEVLDSNQVKPMLFLTDLYIEEKKFVEAEKILEKAEQLASTHASEQEIIRCKITRGKLLEKAADKIKQAYVLYQQALKQAKSLGLFQEILKANLELARLDIIEGNYTGAELFLKAVQTPASQHQLTYIQVKALVLRSIYFSAQLDFTKALELLQTALEIALETELRSIIPKIKKETDQISESALLLEAYDNVIDFLNSDQGRKHQKATRGLLEDYISALGKESSDDWKI
ncbi:MAG: tetratricopeptide repeat protein [Promethearchaeota archaeon]